MAHAKTIQPFYYIREAFKKYLQKTYEIFHMLVDPDIFFPLKDQKYLEKFQFRVSERGGVTRENNKSVSGKYSLKKKKL